MNSVISGIKHTIVDFFTATLFELYILLFQFISNFVIRVSGSFMYVQMADERAQVDWLLNSAMLCLLKRFFVLQKSLCAETF